VEKIPTDQVLNETIKKDNLSELDNEETFLINDQMENYESFSARDDKNDIFIKETDETDSILNEQNENDCILFSLIKSIELKRFIHIMFSLDDQISVKQVQLTILQHNLEKIQKEYSEFLKLTEVS